MVSFKALEQYQTKIIYDRYPDDTDAADKTDLMGASQTSHPCDTIGLKRMAGPVISACFWQFQSRDTCKKKAS